MLNTSCNLLSTVLKVKSSMDVWVQNGCMCISDHSCNPVADWELWLTAATQYHKRVLYHIVLGWVKSKI